MSCDVAESCEHMLGKLLIKLQQANLPETKPLADLPETKPLADLPTSHNFKKGQIMHIVNNIPKGTAPGMDGNRAKFYKYYAAALSATMANAFQQAYSRCWRKAPGRRPSARSLTTGGPSFSSRRCPNRCYTSTRPSTTSAN